MLMKLFEELLKKNTIKITFRAAERTFYEIC